MQGLARFWTASVALAGVMGLTSLGPVEAADLPTRKAAPVPVAEPAACDFFEAELIGYLCGRTAFVGVAGQGYQLTNTFSRPTVLSTFNRSSVTRQAYETGVIAITPWEGFRLSVSDQAFQYKNSVTTQTVPNAGPAGPAATTIVSGSQAGWLRFGGEYTLWDRRNEWGRFLTNIVVDFEHFQGGGPYASRDLQMIGWNSSFKYTLGGSGFSLNYFGNTLFQHFDGPNETRLTSYSRVLLANDVWGVGVGPRLNTVNELWHAAGVNTGWSETSLGGEALIEPFRMTQVAVLKDITLDGYYVHSIGQAGLVPNWNGKTSSYEFGGAARFNFRF